MAYARDTLRGVDELGQDAAIGDPLAACALRSKRGELGLEGLQRGELGAHAIQLSADQPVHIFAGHLGLPGEIEQAPDLRERHVEGAAMAYEVEPLKIVLPSA